MDDAYLAQTKRQIVKALEYRGVEAIACFECNDIHVSGSLTDIVEVYLNYRSEIEELG